MGLETNQSLKNLVRRRGLYQHRKFNGFGGLCSNIEYGSGF